MNDLHQLVAENDKAITAALHELSVILANLISETLEYGTDEHKRMLRDMLTTALSVMQES